VTVGLDDYLRVPVASRSELRAWLAANHDRGEGIWLVTHKRTSGLPAPAYDDIVEEALCFGWIDSTVRGLDDTRSMLLLTPRKPTSTWAATNKERVARLAAEGLIQEPGWAAIRVAQQNGSWTILDSVEALEVPTDLAAALAERVGAAENFAAFSASSRKAILWWVVSAKRADTRARRVATTARLAADGIRANHPEAQGR
jgi:uncharacterized protein YdeI (YjbR/CyaY-like superfamily)